MTRPGIGQLIAGAGGIALIVSLFMPWAEVDGASRTGWEMWTMADLFLLFAGVIAIAAMVTGGRIGLFRPDVSLNGATDILGVAASVMVVWFVAFDVPDSVSLEAGAYVALIGAVVQAFAAADWSVLRGAAAFPRLEEDARRVGSAAQSRR